MITEVPTNLERPLHKQNITSWFRHPIRSLQRTHRRTTEWIGNHRHDHLRIWMSCKRTSHQEETKKKVVDWSPCLPQKRYCLIPVLVIHPFIHSGTLSLSKDLVMFIIMDKGRAVVVDGRRCRCHERKSPQQMYGCFLLIDKARAKYKTYTRVSVVCKTKR